MSHPRRSVITIAFCTFSLSILAGAQDLSLTRPGSQNLFRPFYGAGEGIFTPLPFRLSSYGTVGYDDNVFAQHNDPIGSVYDELGLNLDVNLGGQRTQLSATASAGIVAYWERPGSKIDPNISLNLALNHNISERTVLNFSTALSYQAQPDVSSGVGPLNVVGNYLDSANKLSLGFQWSKRIATFTSYSLHAIHYDSSAVGESEDRFEQLIDEEIRFLLRPAVVAVLEYRFGWVDYLHSSTNNSHSHYFVGGADLMMGPRLNFGFRAGAELRCQNVVSPGGKLYPYAESTLTYKFRPESTLEWYTRYGLEQSDFSINSSGDRKTFRTGLKIAHAFGAKLNAVAAAYYSNNAYSATPTFTENVFEASLGATYQITRKFSLNAGYTLTRDFSTLVFRDYGRSRIYGGISYFF